MIAPAKSAGHRRTGAVNYTIAPPALHVWHGIEAECPPVRRHDYGALLDMAQHMLAQRQRAYPKMIERREIAAEAAQADIDAITDLAADWRWVVTGAGAPAHLASLAARGAALDKSIITIADIARDSGGFSDDLAARALLVIALRWWCDLPNILALHAAARANHALRAGTFFAKEAPAHAA